MRTAGDAIDELVEQFSSVQGVFILEMALTEIVQGQGSVEIGGKLLQDCPGYEKLEQAEAEMLARLKQILSEVKE